MQGSPLKGMLNATAANNQAAGNNAGVKISIVNVHNQFNIHNNIIINNPTS